MEPGHHKSAEMLGRNLSLLAVLDLLQNVFNDILHRFQSNGSLFRGFRNTSKEFRPLENLVTTVAFDNTQFIALQYFIGCKARLAIEAFPATTDRRPIFGKTGVNDLVIESSTFRTAHICCIERRSTGKITTRYSEVNFIFHRRKILESFPCAREWYFTVLAHALFENPTASLLQSQSKCSTWLYPDRVARGDHNHRDLGRIGAPNRWICAEKGCPQPRGSRNRRAVGGAGELQGGYGGLSATNQWK